MYHVVRIYRNTIFPKSKLFDVQYILRSRHGYSDGPVGYSDGLYTPFDSICGDYDVLYKVHSALLVPTPNDSA